MRMSASALILILASLVGVAAFLSPFFAPTLVQSEGMVMAHSQDALFVLLVLTLLALAAVFAHVRSGQMSAKTLALLGALAAVAAVLRFVPGPAGFSAVFFLPILAGYVFGAQFGFLVGVLTLLASAFMTGGVGPWLPYQMFASGWTAAAVGVLPRPRPHSRAEIALLAAAGFVLGLFYGAVMNLWFWPFVFQPSQAHLYWQPGQGAAAALRSYALFYLATSLWWDVWRGVGNAALIVLFGAPVLRLLRRYEQRFHFVVG